MWNFITDTFLMRNEVSLQMYVDGEKISEVLS